MGRLFRIAGRGQWLVCLVAVLYCVAAGAFWYAMRGSFWGGPHAVLVMMSVGTILLLLLAGVATSRWRPSRESLVVVIASLSFLAAFWSLGRMRQYGMWFEYPQRGAPDAMYPFYYFSASSVLFRLALPLCVSYVLLRRGLSFYGWSRGQRTRWLHLYWIGFVVAAICAIVVSRYPAFVFTYPLCRHAIHSGQLDWQSFILYQGAYLLLFLSGEAFWRGYLLFGLERQYGNMAVFIALIPYVSVHLGKPKLEMLGAIVTGTVLGFLALRHRSFLYGVAVHWGVAIVMDIAALWRRGVTMYWG